MKFEITEEDFVFQVRNESRLVFCRGPELPQIIRLLLEKEDGHRSSPESD